MTSVQRERVTDDIYVFTSNLYAQVTAGLIVTGEGAILIDMSGPIEVLENRARQLIGGGHSELLPFMGWQAE